MTKFTWKMTTKRRVCVCPSKVASDYTNRVNRVVFITMYGRLTAYVKQCGDDNRRDVLCDLRGVHAGMVVIQHLLEEHQSLGFKLLGSREDLVHVLHVLGVVRVQLVE